MFLNRVPMDRDTPSPEPQVYSFIHAFIHSFIHSFIHVCLPESPKRSPPAYGEKHKVTVHGAPSRRKAYIQWGAPWFPKVPCPEPDMLSLNTPHTIFSSETRFNITHPFIPVCFSLIWLQTLQSLISREHKHLHFLQRPCDTRNTN